MARGRSRSVGTSGGGRPRGSDAPRVALPETVLPRHHVDLYGTRLSFVDAGEGDPVVLLHGITCSAASWNRLLPALAAHHRVIAPDMPGHGWSSRARGDHSIAGFALHVRDLLMGLGIQRATFVGHSLGGGVTMQTAYAYPELVGRMVLVASGGSASPSGCRCEPRPEQGLEVADAEAGGAVALDDLVEQRRAVLDGLGEDLQQVALVVAVDEDAELLQLVPGLVDLADAGAGVLVVGVGDVEELHARGPASARTVAMMSPVDSARCWTPGPR